MRVVIAVGVLAALLVTVFRASHRSLSRSDETEIIAAALDSLFASPTTALLVFRDSSSSTDNTAYLRKRGFPTVLIDDLRRRNEARVHLRTIIDTSAFGKPVSFLAARPAGDQMFAGVNWEGFYKAFPGSNGVITISRPGVNANATHALIYLGYICGGRCGTWGYAMLERRQTRWVVTRFVVTARS